MSEIQGLVEAARLLGLPLPRLVPSPDASPAVQQSAPARLRKSRAQGTSPEHGSPTKRPASSGDKGSVPGEAAGQHRRLRRRVQPPRESTSAPRSRHRREGSPQAAQQQARALAELREQAQQARQAADARIAQLQAEVGHWRSQAVGLATDAQQLRHFLVMSEMQLDAAQQHVRAAELFKQQVARPATHYLPAGHVAPLAWQPGGEGEATPLPSLPCHCEAGGLPTATAGLDAPLGPLPECEDWADALLPDLDFAL